MERVKEYLKQIEVPFEEEQTDGMTVLKLKYCEDLLAIFPPGEGEEEFHAVTAYDGKVQQYARMDIGKLKEWLHAVFVEESPDYVYEDEMEEKDD